jgi:hypothetical protein
MSGEPQPLSETPRVAQPSTTRRYAGLVTEDWLLAVWVSIATPLLFRAQGGGGPFDSGAPLLGALRIVAVAGTLICLAARRAPGDAATDRSIINGGAMGPLVGAIILVTISGFTALDLPRGFGTFIVIAALAAMVLVHFAVPPLAAPVRRALVTPFVLVSGALFWTFIAAVTGEPGSATPETGIANPSTALAAGGFLVAFSGVFYVMLIFAPRQVADREGGIVTWLFRYALFAAGVIAGLAWPRLLGI